ncbi:LacI family DNA-binding transcriptional regulator [Demequina mangrovi]|uniref:Transcriptional regulator, LacI family n=1 Tax=Demequina mangrovi TaxID=1043493 RepID=A0A1H6UQ75_9MICO|nr:LacI family DNA-binding transcriptional regulator [Demequina mangrovi]SEI92854.1 transcriptional regulator, LacI family [Demequina mangrovi]
MAVSVREVAARAGVSVGTVSNVLNRPEQVKPETVARVRAAIDALGYVPNDAARQLRAGRSQSLALLVLDVGNPFFTDVARGAEKRAAEEGLTVLLANSDESAEREAGHLDVFERQRVSGVLISPVDGDYGRLEELRRHGIPVVLVDRGADQARFASVSVDDVEGGRLAARHLLERGCRRLAFVGGPLRIGQVADRFQGASAAVAEHGSATIQLLGTDEMSLDEGRRVGEALRPLIRETGVDGIVAANDLLAIGVERALLFGPDPIRVPDEVALVGYDDISFAASAVVPISSVRQPRELIGATAVELLLAEASRPDTEAPRHVVYAPELVVRDSSTRSA